MASPIRTGRPGGANHARWLSNINLGLPARKIALGELISAVREAEARLKRREAAIEELGASWELGDLVMTLRALRGFQLIAAVTIVAQLGDISRFSLVRDNQTQVKPIASRLPIGQIAQDTAEARAP